MAAADQELASLYGVSAAVIEGLRIDQCTKGVHWDCEPVNRVVWRADGLAFLDELLGLKKKKGGAVDQGWLLVLRIFPNPIWVQVATPEGGTATVRVRRNKNLQIRMQIDCKRAADGSWICVHPGLAPN